MQRGSIKSDNFTKINRERAKERERERERTKERERERLRERKSQSPIIIKRKFNLEPNM